MRSVKVYTGESRPYTSVLLVFLLFVKQEFFKIVSYQSEPIVCNPYIKACVRLLLWFCLNFSHHVSAKSTLLSNQTQHPLLMDGITSLFPAFLLTTEQCPIQFEPVYYWMTEDVSCSSRRWACVWHHMNEGVWDQRCWGSLLPTLNAWSPHPASQDWVRCLRSLPVRE